MNHFPRGDAECLQSSSVNTGELFGNNSGSFQAGSERKLYITAKTLKAATVALMNTRCYLVLASVAPT